MCGGYEILPINAGLGGVTPVMPPFPAGVGDVALFEERPNVAAGGVGVVKQGVDIGVDACAGSGDDGVVMLAKFGGGNVRADGNVAKKSQLRGGSGVVLKLSVADEAEGGGGSLEKVDVDVGAAANELFRQGDADVTRADDCDLHDDSSVTRLCCL